MPVTLIGYRGSGKSAVGHVLAQRLGWDFVDADDEIERRAGQSIAAIFADEGEAGFRKREIAVMEQLLTRCHCVIAAGGGVILAEQTRARLAESGPVVYLRVTPAVAERRMTGDSRTAQRRPALTSLPRREEIESVMAERERLYQQCATLTVDASEDSVETIVETIRAALSEETDVPPEPGR